MSPLEYVLLFILSIVLLVATPYVVAWASGKVRSDRNN